MVIGVVVAAQRDGGKGRKGMLKKFSKIFGLFSINFKINKKKKIIDQACFYFLQNTKIF
jgi:hypothetical protein